MVFPYGPFSGYRPLLHHRRPLTEKFVETPANQTSYDKNVTLSDFPFCLWLFSNLENCRYPYWLRSCLCCGGCCYYWILCAKKKELLTSYKRLGGNVFVRCGGIFQLWRPEEPAIQISTLLLRIYVAPMWPDRHSGKLGVHARNFIRAKE